MEEKTTAQKGTQTNQVPTTWIKNVAELAETIGRNLNDDSGKDRRAIIVVAVDGNMADEPGQNIQMVAGIAGNSIALGLAVKHILTGEPFADHLQSAAKMMAMDAALGNGKGTVVIDLRDDEDDAPEAENETQEGAEA